MEICELSEKEKKAIKNIKEMIENIFKCEDDEEFVCDVSDGGYLQTALNLIQKQDKKIKDLKEHNSNLIRKSGEDIDLLLKQIDSKDTEINKLNNVIDLMSKSILNYDDQLVINYYKDKEHVKETFIEYAMKEDK